jgi:hypothetical protein
MVLSRIVDRLSSWADCWQLKFNVSKSYHLGITSKWIPHMYNYCLNDQIICREWSTKYLGVTITGTLRWNEHCDNICKKANSTLGLLKRILGSWSPAVKARAYLSLVRSKLEYASCVWNPHTKRNSEKIEMIQHRAPRFVNNDFSRYSHACFPNDQQFRMGHTWTA